MGNRSKVGNTLKRSKIFLFGSLTLFCGVETIFINAFAQSQEYGTNTIPVFNTPINYNLTTTGTGCSSLLSGTTSGVSDAEALLNKAIGGSGSKNASGIDGSILGGGSSAAASPACTAEGNFKKNAAAMLAELDCFQKMIEAGRVEMNNLQKSIEPVLEQAGAVVKQYDKDLGDRKSQLAEVSKRGSEIDKQRDTIKALVLGAASEASSARLASKTKQAVTDFRLKQSQFKTAQTQYEVGLAMNCFLKEPKAGYKCISGGPDVSASEYIKCSAISASQRDAKGNVISNDKLKERIATTLTSEISALNTNAPVLDSFTNDVTTKNYTYKSMNDVEKYFTSRFKGMKALKGMTADVAIRNSMNSCYSAAKSKANKELMDATKTSGLAREAKAIEDQGNTLRDDLISGITKQSDVYSEALKAVTGNSDIKLNTGPCVKGSLESQADCAQQMDTLLSSLLNGTVSSSSARSLSAEAAQLTGGAAPITSFSRDIVAPSEMNGSSKRLSFTMKCNGLNACSSAYKTAYEQIEKMQEQLVTGRKTYVDSANAAVNAKVNIVAAALSQRSKLINDKKGALIAALSRLGIKGGMNLEGDAGEKDINPGEGVYRNSQVDDLIRGKINPPFFKDGDGIQSAKDNVLAKQEELKKACSEAIASMKEDKKSTLDKCYDDFSESEDDIKSNVKECKSDIKIALSAKELACKDKNKDGTKSDYCDQKEGALLTMVQKYFDDEDLNIDSTKIAKKCEESKNEYDPKAYLKKYSYLVTGSDLKNGQIDDCQALATHLQKPITDSTKDRAGSSAISGGLYSP